MSTKIMLTAALWLWTMPAAAQLRGPPDPSEMSDVPTYWVDPEPIDPANPYELQNSEQTPYVPYGPDDSPYGLYNPMDGEHSTQRAIFDELYRLQMEEGR